MIFGIGTDVTDVKRFKKWVETEGYCERFFNPAELKKTGSVQHLCEHYSVRFAAKEAFSKALGTGLSFDLKDVYITNDESGKPSLNVTGKAKELLQQKAGNCNLFVSLSHEKEVSVAFVIIESI